MKIGGHGMQEHIRLLVPLFVFIAAVWLLRMILAAAESPMWLVTMISVTTATAVAILLAVVLIHHRNFGGYPNVVASSFLLNIWAQILIIGAIAFAVLTETENIYTLPQFSVPGHDPLHLNHMYGQLTFGIGTGTLAGAAGGCLLLWLLRRLVPYRSKRWRAGRS
jgi:hypothetical protein